MFDLFIDPITFCVNTLITITVFVLLAYPLYPAITYDIPYLYRMARFKRRHKRWIRENITIVDRFEEMVEKQGDKTLLYFEDRKISYSEINREANRMMIYLLGSGGVKLRDAVGILMVNEPLFVSTWLAIAKCGAVSSLLNTKLRGKSLMHCIKISGSRVVVCSNDTSLLGALTEIKPQLDEIGVRVLVTGSSDVPSSSHNFMNLTHLSQSLSDKDNKSAREGIDVTKDALLHMFTSGTTGLPKATLHTLQKSAGRAHFMSNYGCGPDDVYYICLPLYHGVSFNIGVISTISTGASAVLRRKFSVRGFWDDVRRYRITVILYIGETLRYLVQAPRSDLDGIYPHGVIRLASGSGLKADIWREFKERFNVQQISEYYGSTDGNSLTINFDGREGTVGRYTPLLEKLLDIPQIIEYETETAEPRRGPDGLCIKCPKGTAGLAVTIVSENRPISGYIGNPQASERKLIRDVFQKGDCYFDTGDLLMIDRDGYVYFKDRIGNTFRWKGENVASTEVEEALLENSQVSTANVYGVKIEGRDGRAGMASLLLQGAPTLDRPAMYKHITDRLPSYACPKFIRIKDSMEMTGTLKLRKVNLVKEGFDPRTISDPLYYMDDKEQTYSVLDEESFNAILAGTIRL